ncbi:hypothetical protein [Massilia sp. TWR1-2-2]|uniref:hypothetical protein n=1 Tax=Massilia sp. TWR1-2-2 TaxID=2804584 RepID=UPI003CF5F31E
MNDEKIYPSWGAFGTATDNSAPEPRSEAVTGASDSAWELKITVGGFGIETKPTDTPEQIAAAMRTAAEIDAERKLTVLLPKLQNTNHALVPFIARAMRSVRATGFDLESLGRVWIELVRMAGTDESPDEVTGYIHGKGIRYRGGIYGRTQGSEFDHYARRTLAALFKRQEEHHAKSRQVTSSHAS